MEELHILITLNKEHKKVFPDEPVVGLQNGKSLKDYLVRAKLSTLEGNGRCEPCGKKRTWPVILYLLPQHLLQKHAKKLLKFRKAT